LRKYDAGPHKFYARGITLYPEDALFREMAFISYYFHWSREEVQALSHNDRRRWCREISEINASLSPSKKKEKSILEFGRTPVR
jgi:hypothetical protein